MDLDAEHLVAIEVLQEQWEGLRLLISQDFIWKRIDQVAKSPAFPGAIRNDALVGPVVDDFPAFGPGTGAGQRFSHQPAKAFSAPQIRAKKRMESQRGLGKHGGSRYDKDRSVFAMATEGPGVAPLRERPIVFQRGIRRRWFGSDLEVRGRVVKTSKSDDLFESSTMTFGEHLEELRVSLTKALICLAVGMGISLLFADRIVRYVQTPLKKSLEEFYLRKAGAQWEKANGSKMDPTLQEWMAEQKYTPEVVYVDPRELMGSLQGVQVTVPGLDPTQPPAQETSGSATSPAALETPSDSIPSALPTTEPAVPSSKTPDVVPPVSKTPDEAPSPPTPMQVSGLGKGKGSVEATGLEGWRGGSALQAKDLVPLRLFSRISTNTDALQVTEPFMIYLKAGLAAGLVLASPGIFWYLWGFIASGLYPHERRYVYFFLPVSLFLFLGGAALAFFFIFELVLRFLLTFNESLGIDAAPRLTDYMTFALMLPLGFGVAFQLPLAMLVLERLGVFSVEIYLKQWRTAVLVIAFISMVLTPAEITSMVGMLVPLVGLYFLGILLCKYLPRGSALGTQGYDAR
jgi:sec-independent protein translocase protein TatC